MKGKFLIGAVAVLLLMGAGCNLSSKVSLGDFHLPNFGSSATSTPIVSLKPGLSMVIEPTYLGLEGSIADLLGSQQQQKTATVKAYDGDHLRLTWSTTSTDSTSTINAKNLQELLRCSCRLFGL